MVQLKQPDGAGDGRHNGVHHLHADDDEAALSNRPPSAMEQEEAEERAALLRLAQHRDCITAKCA